MISSKFLVKHFSLLVIGCYFYLEVFRYVDAHDCCQDELKEKLDESWYRYRILYNKTYTGHLLKKRRIAWQRNMELIVNHNELYEKGLSCWKLKSNRLADLDPQDYQRKILKLKASRPQYVPDGEMVGAVLKDPNRLPSSFDWTNKGFTTSSENQLDCASCYAFSVLGSIAGQIFKKTQQIVDLSEQQLVDCSRNKGNLGCDGGSLRNTLRYLEEADGIMTEESYPYIAQEGTCKFQKKLKKASVKKWAMLPAQDERALKAAISTIGPIAISVDASSTTFQLYSEGIYDDPECSSSEVNHAMLVVGYTEDYWILKNWWGEEWGENGYMRLRKGINRCGIANYAIYATIKED